MQPIYHEMSDHYEDGPTPASIAAARAATAEARAQITEETGVHFREDGIPIIPHRFASLKMPVLAGGMALSERVDCAEAVDAAVETYGLEAVIRAVKLLAAMNGRTW